MAGSDNESTRSEGSSIVQQRTDLEKFADEISVFAASRGITVKLVNYQGYHYDLGWWTRSGAKLLIGIFPTDDYGEYLLNVVCSTTGEQRILGEKYTFQEPGELTGVLEQAYKIGTEICGPPEKLPIVVGLVKTWIKRFVS